MECPCRFCQSREIGCHSNCSDYIEWIEIRKANNKNAVEYRKSQKDTNDYYVNKHIKLNRRRRGK